jgi:hypothetical protein
MASAWPMPGNCLCDATGRWPSLAAAAKAGVRSARAGRCVWHAWPGGVDRKFCLASRFFVLKSIFFHDTKVQFHIVICGATQTQEFISLFENAFHISKSNM